MELLMGPSCPVCLELVLCRYRSREKGTTARNASFNPTIVITLNYKTKVRCKNAATSRILYQ